MMQQPIYRSLADSFRLDFFMPRCGLIAPPAVTCPASEALEAQMTSAAPPQAVWMEVTGDLIAWGATGQALGNLEQCLRKIKGKAYPILEYRTAEAGKALAAFAEDHCIGDLTLCVPYDCRELLPPVRAALPLSRGMVDCRGKRADVPADLLDLAGDCREKDAVTMLLDWVPERKELRRLQKRFTQVWIDCTGGLDPADAVLAGACGVCTHDPAGLYALFQRFPEDTTVRPTALFAHKALHITREYPENSIAASAAAGQRGYDGAEIDVTMTKDLVAMVHHDKDTGNLFTEDLVVMDSTFDQVSSLRRKGFADSGMDRFDQLMTAMANYPETPMVIELKTPVEAYTAEEVVRQMEALFQQPDTQKYCTCIMGRRPPYLHYLHRRLPRLPLAHVVGSKVEAPTDPDALNLRIYQFSEDTRGGNAAYNPDVYMLNPLMARLMHLRGITLFPWTWAFEPWETECDRLCAAFRSGYDGMTSDWVTKFADFPIDLRPALPETAPAGAPLSPTGFLLHRTGEQTKAAGLTVLPLSGEITLLEDGSFTGKGSVKVALVYQGRLPDGKGLGLCSEGARIQFD